MELLVLSYVFTHNRESIFLNQTNPDEWSGCPMSHTGYAANFLDAILNMLDHTSVEAFLLVRATIRRSSCNALETPEDDSFTMGETDLHIWQRGHKDHGSA